MSVVMSALHAAQMSAVQAAFAFAAKNGEEFNPDKVTPGPEGFIATAVFAAAVITLGFLLVTRIRRNSYRHEIREDIAAEIAEVGTHTPAAGSSSAGAESTGSTGAGADGGNAPSATDEHGGVRPGGA